MTIIFVGETLGTVTSMMLNDMTANPIVRKKVSALLNADGESEDVNSSLDTCNYVTKLHTIIC